MRLGKITAEDLREKYFYKKAIKNHRRLRQIWVKFFGFWFFKDVPSKLAKEQVKKIDQNVNCQEDINTYMAKNMVKEFDRSKPLWEIHVIEDYDEDTSMVFFFMHHIIADGMSMVNLMTLMNDNHNPEEMDKRTIPFVYMYIIPFLYIPLGIYRFIVDSFVVRGDKNMTPLQLKGGVQSKDKIYMESNNYELSDLRKCYSQYVDTKLNSYMFATVSVALSKYLEELGIPKERHTHFSLSVPVNMKPMAYRIEEVQFYNTCSLVLTNVPISQDIAYITKEVKKTWDYRHTLQNLRLGIWIVSFMGAMSEVLYRITSFKNQSALDMIISNTPGPPEPIFFCDEQVLGLGGVGPNVGDTGLTILISSYCGKVKMQILADKNLQMDPKRLMEHFEMQLDRSIAEATE
jgi:diacylglycerol O-acyltransferase